MQTWLFDLTLRRRGLVLPILVVLVASLAVPVTASAQQAPSQEGDARTFSETGFRIDDDAIWTYFAYYGGQDTLGAPVSRMLTLNGVQVQIFQRAVLQVGDDGSVQPVSLASDGWLPVTHLNGLTLPSTDDVLTVLAPKPEQPSYGTRLLEFTRSVVPDVWQGLHVHFQSTLFATPGALEVWGAPTSRPAADPNNPKFVYQRFERGVLMYNGQAGTTQWLPLGDALKAVVTGRNLPSDLAAETAGSPLLRAASSSDAFQPNVDLAATT